MKKGYGEKQGLCPGFASNFEAGSHKASQAGLIYEISSRSAGYHTEGVAHAGQTAHHQISYFYLSKFWQITRSL